MMKKIIFSGLPAIQDLLIYELQNGFLVETEGGISLISFLIESCEIPESYIKDKVKTIFHNGNPVDSLTSVKLHHDSVVAISGAMPGIVGAMMRIGSPYAAMRESITEKGSSGEDLRGKISVKLKLFNVIMSDLGKVFIEKGVILGKESILRIIKNSVLNAGSEFSFMIDDEEIISSDTARLTDSEYIVSAHQ